MINFSGPETEILEYKIGFNPSEQRDWVELVKDIVAMANTDGGQIAIGLNDDGSPGTIPIGSCQSLDVTHFVDKVFKYTNIRISGLEYCIERIESSDIAVIGIKRSEFPLIFSSPGTYEIPQSNGKQKTAFSVGQFFVRHSARSDPASFDDLKSWILRKIDEVRQLWLSTIVTISEAPLGSKISVLPPEVMVSDAGSSTPINLVNDPSAATFYAYLIDKTHPHRLKGVVQLINPQILPDKINREHVIRFRKRNNTDSEFKYCYRLKNASPQYSDAFISYFIECYRADKDVF